MKDVDYWLGIDFDKFTCIETDFQHIKRRKKWQQISEQCHSDAYRSDCDYARELFSFASNLSAAQSSDSSSITVFNGCNLTGKHFKDSMTS